MSLLEQIDKGTRFQRDKIKKNIKSYKAQENVESHNSQQPEEETK